MRHWRSHSKKVNSQFATMERIEGRNPPGIKPKRNREVEQMEDVEEEVFVQPDREESITVAPRRIIPPPPEELQNAQAIGEALVAAGLDRSTTRRNLYYRIQGSPVISYWQAEDTIRSPYFYLETADYKLRYHIVEPLAAEDYNEEEDTVYFDDLQDLITHMTRIVRS